MYDQFCLPDLGEGLAEAEIVQWLVRPGEPVALNQPLVEVETAKAAVEIPSPFAGIVHALHCAEGDQVLVGAPLLTVAADGPASAPAPAAPAPADEAPPALVVGRAPVEPAGDTPRRRPRRAAGQRPATLAAASSAVPVPRTPTAPVAAPAAVPVVANGKGARARVLAAPPVRRLARDLGVDLAALAPSGPGGTIARADVTAAARLVQPGPGPATAAAPTAGAAGTGGVGGAAEQPAVRPGDRLPVRGVARQMALAMERSAFTVPQATVARTVDVTAMTELLARWRADAQAAAARAGRPPARVTPLAFIARAVVAALALHPLANSRWLTGPDGSNEIELFGAVHLGVAVASDRGLVVPVVPDAEALTLPALAGALAELVATARAGRTPPERMRGSTITLSNVGVFGVDSAAGLVRDGEAALVVLGAIRETAAVWEGQVQVRKVMTISLSFDHRILDGEAAARFLGDIAEVLADPPRLLLLG